jgi:hypothetical protein
MSEKEPEEWLVWSYEHNAWWGPNHCGYYTDLGSAGLYTEPEAKHIEYSANRGGERNEEARPLSRYADEISERADQYITLLIVLHAQDARAARQEDR